MASYYVRTDGDDGNDGLTDSAGGAWLTMDHALSQVSAGDTVNVGAGTFAGTAATATAGSSGSPITISGDGMGSTLFTGITTATHAWHVFEDITWSFSYLLIDGADDVTMRRVEAYGATYGIRMTNYPERATLDGVVLHHPNARNGMLDAGGPDGLVINSTFRDNNGNDAVRLNGAWNWTFRGNSFLRLKAPGFYAASSTSSNTVGTGSMTFVVDADPGYTILDRLRFTASGGYVDGRVTSIVGTSITVNVTATSGSGTFSAWDVTCYDADDHADIFQVFSFDSYGHVIERNLFKDCSAQCGNVYQTHDYPTIPVNEDIRDWTIRNNIFIESRIQFNVYAPGFEFYNNTVYSYDEATGFRGATDNDGTSQGDGVPVTVYNNIFCRVGSTESAGPYMGADADYNLITDHDDTEKTGFSETNGINGGYTPAEIFTDPDNDDFTLATGSPAIGAGVDLSSKFTDDFNGDLRDGWDIGAYVYDGPAPPTTPPNPPTNLTLTAL